MTGILFFLRIRRPPRSTPTDTLFPVSSLFRSAGAANLLGTSKSKTPVPAPTPVRESRSKPRDYSGILRAEFGQDAITSGCRSQAEQNALVTQGVTSAKRSSHTYNNGFDLSIGYAKSEEEIRNRLGDRKSVV